jgi:hypothetical protein
MTQKRLQQAIEKIKKAREAVQKNQVNETITLLGEAQALAEKVGEWLSRREK